MQIAVLGSKGLLGGELCRVFGPTVIPLDRPMVDLTQPASVQSALATIRPHVLINTAAYTDVDKAEEEPDLCHRVNAEALAPLAQACRNVDCALVHISSDYVFGADRARTRPYGENDPTGPVNVYGRSKLASEQRAARYSNTLIVRTCGLYGGSSVSRQRPHFVHRILQRAAQVREFFVVDDQHCTPTNVRHLACAIEYLIRSGIFGTVHITNTGEASWYEFAREVLRRAGTVVSVRPVSTAAFAAPAARPSYSVLDTGKYHTLGGPPMPTWQDALREYLDHDIDGHAN